jgi:hypothetical protein
LRDARYQRFPELLALRNQEKAIQGAGLQAPEEAARAYHASYGTVLEGMVERSMPQLINWVSGLPPSPSGIAKLTSFVEATFGMASVPDRFIALRDAFLAKRASYNPSGFARPEIVMALRGKFWADVSADGLEDLAYLATAFNVLDKQCPGTIPAHGSPENNGVLTYVLEKSKDAVSHFMRGEIKNKTEGQRALMLMLNAGANQPGCQVNQFGIITRCTTAQEQSDIQQALLTSADAVDDMKLLGRGGCGSDDLRSFSTAGIEFMVQHSKERGGMTLPDAWQLP